MRFEKASTQQASTHHTGKLFVILDFLPIIQLLFQPNNCGTPKSKVSCYFISASPPTRIPAQPVVHSDRVALCLWLYILWLPHAEPLTISLAPFLGATKTPNCPLCIMKGYNIIIYRNSETICGG